MSGSDCEVLELYSEYADVNPVLVLVKEVFVVGVKQVVHELRALRQGHPVLAKHSDYQLLQALARWLNILLVVHQNVFQIFLVTLFQGLSVSLMDILNQQVAQLIFQAIIELHNVTDAQVATLFVILES